jgi:hypothetical protein
MPSAALRSTGIVLAVALAGAVPAASAASADNPSSEERATTGSAQPAAPPPVARAGTPVVVGSTGTTGTGFVPLAANVTAVQTATASGSQSYTVPAAGVLTSISHDEGPTGGFFRAVLFGPPTSATMFPVRGFTPKLPSLANSLNTHATQIPVAAGTILGIWTEAAAMSPVKTTVSAANSYSPAVVDPTTILTFNGTAPVANRQVNISAVWEPDADGDGFGDVSQDLCPTSATTHAACGGDAPDTTVARAPKNKSTKRKVKITFSSTIAGSTFTCAVDKSAAKPCTSPFKKKFKVGKHTVVITATSPAGIVDATPVTVTFKIKKPRR